MGTLDRIKRLSEQGERDTAQKELVAFLRDDPRNVDAWWMLAQVLIDPRKKIEAYRHILNLDPEHMEAARQFAVLTLPPGQPLEASEEYQNALAEYYRKRDEMPQIPEPAEDISPPEEQKPDTGSPLDTVQRAFPIQQPRNVGELEVVSTDEPAEQAAPDLEPVSHEPVSDTPGAEIAEVQAEQEERASEPVETHPIKEQGAEASALDVESKPLDDDEYPEEFKEALKNMRLQQGLRPEGPKPDVWKAAQSGLRPDMLRTDFVSDALGSSADRRIQDLADGNMETLEPLQEDQRIQCPNCKATIAKDSEKCEWCGEKLTTSD